MSAYVVNDATISAIVKGFVDCNYAEYNDGNPREIQCIIDLSKERQRIGQSLLNENYRSVNHRYCENDSPHDFKFVDVEVNAGIILGCVQCYIYQTGETKDFEDSEIYKSLVELKEGMLKRLILQSGYKVPWGIH